MIKQRSMMWTAMAVTLLFAVIHVHAVDVCPDTISQGGGNSSGAVFTLHDSVGGFGGSQSSAAFVSDIGYAPQVLCGCDCVPCADFVDLTCESLQLNFQTTQTGALPFLEALLASSDLFSADICADGSDVDGCPEACAAFILSNFEP